MPRSTAPISPALWVSAAVAVLAIYWLRLDHVAGLIVDDAWYVLLGKALAHGDGYTLVSAPTTGVPPPNPPLFAALLSLVFRVRAEFPANVLWLKAVSIAAMFGAGALTFAVARVRRGWKDGSAFTIALLVTLTPAFVFLATSTVMAECVFTFGVLAAVMLVHREGQASTMAAAFVGALTALIRTIGVAIPAGFAAYFLLTRQWRRAASTIVVTLVTLTPWQIYSRQHVPTAAQRADVGGAHAYTYGQEFWMRWAGNANSGTITWRDLPARVRETSFDVFGRDIGGLVLPTLYRGGSESGEEVISLGGSFFPASMGSARFTIVLSLFLSAVIAIGFARACLAPTPIECIVPLYLAIVLLWPQWSFRFVLPLAPFIWMYLVEGLKTVVPTIKGMRLGLIASAAVIGLLLLDHAQYILAARSGRAEFLLDAQDVDRTMDWIRGNVTDPAAVIASTNSALIFLRTGHKGIAIDDYETQWPAWRARGVRYLVNIESTTVPPPSVPFVVRYKSPLRGYTVMELQGS